MINLDAKDRKLLFELDFHARDDVAKLAKRVGISPQDVEKTIYDLIEKGVIKGFHPVLNIPKLGYLYCRLVITLQNCPKEKEEDITDYLINYPNVFWLWRMQGMYDFVIVVWVKSLNEFKEFIDEFENKFGKYIKRKLETAATDVGFFRNRFLTGETKGEVFHIKETQDRVTIDKLDRRILQLLSINARFTISELALNLKETEGEINKRMKRLEQTGVIEGYRPLIDHNLIGYTWFKIWLNINKTSQKAFNTLLSYIRNSPLVIYTVEGIGLPADLEIEVMVKSNQELFDFINTMRLKFPAVIGEYNTIMFIEALKELYLPFYSV